MSAFFKTKQVVEMGSSWEAAVVTKLGLDAQAGVAGAKEAYAFFGGHKGEAFESLEALMKTELPYVLAVLIPFRLTHVLTS